MPSTWLNRYAWLTVGATLVLICIGGLVTSKGAGMAVPGLAEHLRVQPVPVPGLAVDRRASSYEHTHRLMGALVGLLTAGLGGVALGAGNPGPARGPRAWALMVLAVGLLGVRAMPVYVALAGLGPAGHRLGVVSFRSGTPRRCAGSA